MEISTEQAYVTPMNGFDLGHKSSQMNSENNQQIILKSKLSTIPTTESYNPEINVQEQPSSEWELDVKGLMSSEMWLRQYGLKRNRLDANSLIPQIGFKKLEDFDHLLRRPVSSKYGDSIFLRHTKEDGKIYNVTVNKEKLKQIENRLLQAVHLYKRRIQWLTSESRRLFGVIQEHCATVILDIKNLSPRSFDTYLCAVERILKEQIVNISKFNLIRCAEEVQYFSPQCVNVTKDNIQMAIDWLWQLDRLAATGSSNTVEAVIRATADPNNEAIYLFTEGSSSDQSREILKDKISKSCRVPFNVVSYNCTQHDTLSFLKNLADITGGYFHAYGITMEVDSFEGLPLDTETNKANIVVRRRLYGGVPGGSGVRKDVLEIFEELEEAQNTLAQIQVLISQTPDPKSDSENRVEQDPLNSTTRREEYMSSEEWLQRFGLDSRKLGYYDILAGVCFRHCDGVVDVMHAPPEAEDEPEEQHDAVTCPRLVNARYCDKFAHVKWKDGQIVHVQVTPEVHRLYEQRMDVALKAVERRIDWLRQGSRELFGTIVEEQMYILMDTSASMEPSIGFVKDKIYTLMQEQLRHKTKVNFVAFNNKAYPWKDRLVDVSEANLKAAWMWIKALSCFGTTNTLAALRFALADRKTHAIYLLTDGRPDQIPETILSQVQLHNRIPVHTISFNCSDPEANLFLCKLAKETGGRFHIFSENGEIVDGPEPWESEDIRLLKEEYDKGVSNLEKVSRLREECQRLAWNKSTNKESNIGSYSASKLRSTTTSGAPLSEAYSAQLGQIQRPPHNFCRQSPRASRKRPQYGRLSRSAGGRLLSASMTTGHKKKQQPFKVGETKSSLLRSLTTSGRFAEDEWMLPEHRNMLERQNARLATKDTSAAERRHKRRTKKMTDEATMSVRCWLKKYSLEARKMTILDALAPTVIHQKPKYVPILDKNVLSKVFDEILPLAHVSYKDKQSIKLVNPLAVDLVAYREKLEVLLQKYITKLNDLVWGGLPADEVNRIRDELGEDEELDFEKHKLQAVQALEACGWPVVETDILLLEQEIETARKYLRQASELEAASKEKTDPASAREVLTDIQQQEHPEFEGFSEVLGMKSAQAVSTGKSPKSGSRDTAAPPDIDPSEKPAPDSVRGVKVVLDSLRGQRIIARNKEDGLYYPGYVVRCPNVRLAQVQFNDLAKDPRDVPTRFCIPVSGAVARPLLRQQDPVLVRVNNIVNKLVCYAPGIITALPGVQRQGSNFYTVKLYTGRKCQSLRTDILKIGETRYNFLIRNLQERANSSSGDVEIRPDVNAPPEDVHHRKSKSRSRSGSKERRKSPDNRRLKEAAEAEAAAEERERIRLLQQEEVGRERQVQKDERKRRRQHHEEDLRTELSRQTEQLQELSKLLEEQKKQMAEERKEMLDQIHRSKNERRGSSRSLNTRSRQRSVTPPDNDRPPSRQGFRRSEDDSPRRLRDSVEPELERLTSVSQLDGETPEKADASPLEEGEEVLSRWLDDGWYYRGIIKEDLADGSFRIEDSCGDGDRFWREDIIKELDDSGSIIEAGSTLVALHPAYSYSYAPAVALGVAGDLSVNVRFYDGEECRLPRVECYLVESSTFETAVRYINECEKKWVGQAVVARDDKSGEYHLGVVRQRIGNGKQYVLEWSNGVKAVQQAGYMFGAFSRRHSFRPADRVLACADRRRLVYLPGWVVSVHKDGKLTVKFLDGTRLSHVDPVHTFWLSQEFYDTSVTYYRLYKSSKSRKH